MKLIWKANFSLQDKIIVSINKALLSIAKITLL